LANKIQIDLYIFVEGDPTAESAQKVTLPAQSATLCRGMVAKQANIFRHKLLAEKF
jgi:hypothetical protein